MREILFRGKRVDNGNWIEGGYAEHDGKTFIVIWTRYSPDTRDWDTVEYYENNPHYTSCLIEVIPETVCQYTGLTDKNGRKIFEGDIVKHDMSDTIGAVKWYCEDYVGLCVDDIHINEQQFTDEMWNECEVIGNIFDNPELIGDQP